MKTLILGGIRSGKSRFAESLAVNSEKPVVYIASATADDQEMQARIIEHQTNRPAHWVLVEEPIHLASALQANAKPDQFVIVDCLTLWLTNLLLTGDEPLLRQELHIFIETVKNTAMNVALVSNETNMGIVPLGALSRKFCDEAGRLHQHLAPECHRVVLMVAGLPLMIKGEAIESHPSHERYPTHESHPSKEEDDL